MQFNQVMIGGNLSRDPQIRFLANDRAVASFGVATNRRWKDAEGNVKEEVTFIDCQAWGKTADFIAKYFAKGSPIFIVGYLRLESWEDKETKQKRSKLALVVDTVQFVGAKKEGSQPAAAAAAKPSSTTAVSSAPATSHAAAGPLDDEPPF